MASSGYTAWAVTAGEVPTTAYWNILGYNDASFNSGTGFNDGAIVSRHLASGIQVAPVEQNPYKFSAYLSTNMTIGDGTTTTVIFDTEIYDTSNNYNNTTGKFTAPVNGYYAYNAILYFLGNATVVDYWEARAMLYYNGATQVDFCDFYTYNETRFTNWSAKLNDVIYLNSGDTIQVLEFGDISQNINGAIQGGRSYSRFSAYLMSNT